MRFLVFTLFVLLFACSPTQNKKPNYVVIHIDSPTSYQEEELDSEDKFQMTKMLCENACDNLHQMDCQSILTKQTAMSCVRLCVDNELFGKKTVNPKCIARSQSCFEAEISIAIGCDRT